MQKLRSNINCQILCRAAIYVQFEVLHIVSFVSVAWVMIIQDSKIFVSDHIYYFYCVKKMLYILSYINNNIFQTYNYDAFT